MPFTETTRDELRALMARYPVARAALLPMLHLVQAHEGQVSADGIGLCAELLGLTKAEVGAVATFYTMYKREPVGDYLLSVCTNPTCKIAGAQEIYDGWVDACGGRHTDPEAGVMIEHAECLGICDAAPVVQINYEMYQAESVEHGMKLLEQAKAGSPPASNRSGHTPATFREVERELSGIDDAFGDRLVAAARRQATSEVPPAYRSGETDIPVTHPGGDPAGHGGQAFAAAAGLAGLDGRAPDADAADASLASLDRRPGADEMATEAERETAAEVAEEGGGSADDLAEHVAEDEPGEAPADASVGAGETMDEAGSPTGDPDTGDPSTGDEAGTPVDRSGGTAGDAATDPADRDREQAAGGPEPADDRDDDEDDEDDA